MSWREPDMEPRLWYCPYCRTDHEDWDCPNCDLSEEPDPDDVADMIDEAQERRTE